MRRFAERQQMWLEGGYEKAAELKSGISRIGSRAGKSRSTPPSCFILARMALTKVVPVSAICPSFGGRRELQGFSIIWLCFLSFCHGARSVRQAACSAANFMPCALFSELPIRHGLNSVSRGTGDCTRTPRNSSNLVHFYKLRILWLTFRLTLRNDMTRPSRCNGLGVKTQLSIRLDPTHERYAVQEDICVWKNLHTVTLVN